MNITVFGASGGIGTHLVRLAAQRGHQVRAIYRTTPHNPPPGQAEILISEDIFDPGFAATAIQGADVVVSAVGLFDCFSCQAGSGSDGDEGVGSWPQGMVGGAMGTRLDMGIRAR